MTSLIITLKKLNQFGKVVQIKVNCSEEIFGRMVRLVEGCFSVEVHELIPFLFLFSLY